MRLLTPLLILGLVAITLVGFWTASTTTVILYPTKDNYAWQSVPNANNGHSRNFQITSATVNPKNMRGWLEFNIHAIPSDAIVIHSDLRLRVWSKSTDDPSRGFGDSTGRI